MKGPHQSSDVKDTIASLHRRADVLHLRQVSLFVLETRGRKVVKRVHRRRSDVEGTDIRSTALECKLDETLSDKAGASSHATTHISDVHRRRGVAGRRRGEKEEDDEERDREQEQKLTGMNKVGTSLRRRE